MIIKAIRSNERKKGIQEFLTGAKHLKDYLSEVKGLVLPSNAVIRKKIFDQLDWRCFIAYQDNKISGYVFYVLHRKNSKNGLPEKEIEIVEFVARNPRAFLCLTSKLIFQGHNNSHQHGITIRGGKKYEKLVEKCFTRFLKYCNQEKIVERSTACDTDISYLYKWKDNGVTRNCAEVVTSHEHLFSYICKDKGIVGVGTNNLDDVLSYMISMCKQEEREKCKELLFQKQRFIIRTLKETNLEILKKAFGSETMRYRVYCRKSLTEKSAKGFEKKLIKKGYHVHGNYNGGDISWSYETYVKLNQPGYGYGLSYYRHLATMVVKDARKNPDAKTIRFIRANGEEFDADYDIIKETPMIVPYLSKNHFKNYLDRAFFISSVRQDPLWASETFLLLKIIKVLGLREAQGFVKKASNYPQQDKHDYNFVFDAIVKYDKFLTKGAKKAFLEMKSYKSIEMKDILESLPNPGLLIYYGKRKRIAVPEMKQLRKELSKVIRTKDVTKARSYVSSVREIIEEDQIKRLDFPEELAPALKEFMVRVSRYSGKLVSSIASCLGKENFMQMVKGTYPGIFESKTFEADQKALGNYITSILQSRTKRAKAIYHMLSQIAPISQITRGQITMRQADMILDALEFRNCDVSSFRKKNAIYLKIEKKCSPEYLVAGDATVCCMTLGAKNATLYALGQGFGVINAYYKDRIIANSVIWINMDHNCLVFDNVEVHPNYNRFNQYLKPLFLQAGEHLAREHNLDYAIQGSNYNDLCLFSPDTNKEYYVDGRMKDVKWQGVYSDAGGGYILDLFNRGTAWLESQIVKINLQFRKIANDDKNLILPGATEESLHRAALNSALHWSETDPDSFKENKDWEVRFGVVEA